MIGIHGVDGAVTSDLVYAGQFEEQASPITAALLHALFPKDVTVDVLRLQSVPLILHLFLVEYASQSETAGR